MKRIFILAWRNLWRTPRRTVVTLAAMTLAVLFMILYTSLMQGYLRDLERDIVDVELGDLQIHAEGYLEKPSLYTRIEDAEQVIEELEESGLFAASRLLSGGLVAAKENSAGALVKGIDLDRNANVTAVAERIESGSWVSADAPLGAVIGRVLARTLGVEVGEELIFLGQASDGSMANELLEVRGVLGPVSEATDRATVFIPESTFRELFYLPEGAPPDPGEASGRRLSRRGGQRDEPGGDRSRPANLASAHAVHGFDDRQRQPGDLRGLRDHLHRRRHPHPETPC